MFLIWLELDKNRRYCRRRSLSVVDLEICVEKTIFIIKKNCILGEVGTVAEEAFDNRRQVISNSKSRI
jgi:predicted transcriptional regulator